MSPVVLFIGLVFSLAAAASAFLIDYQEQLERNQGKRGQLRAAFATSLVAFLVFVGLTLLLARVLPIVAK